MNMTSMFSGVLSVQLASANLVVSGNSALLTVSVKNAGNTPLAGVVVAGYDDNGKCFKLALPPAAPGQTSGNTLVIPLGVPNIVLDGSGNNNHGTIYGATWTDGKCGEALMFDGDDYVTIPHSTAIVPSSITVAVWLKPADINIGNRHPIGEECYYLLRQYETSILWYVFDGIDYEPHCESNGVLEAGVWRHATGTFDAPTGKQRLYISGVLRHEIDHVFAPIGTSPLYIGQLWNEYFKGAIDEVRLYSQAQDTDKVAFSSANPGLPPTADLVLWLPLDEGSLAPFSFTAGSKYALTVTAYTFDGSITTHAITVVATA